MCTKLLFGLVALVMVALLGAPTASAQEAATGYAVRRPLVAAACPTCPWGAVADVLDQAMQSSGYDLEVCYHCSGVPNPRLVSGALNPTPRRPDRANLPQAPNAPIDLGVTNLHRLHWAYHGIHDYRGEPMRNLRVIALIEHPMYLGIAVRAEMMITDLAQIRQRRLPVRIVAQDSPMIRAVLEYYGLQPEAVESWGGRVLRDDDAHESNFDVIIQNQLYLANTPEAGIWYRVSQHNDLRFLALPEDLRRRMARDFNLDMVTIPADYVAGVDRDIPTVGRSGQVVYARDDAPDEFTYAAAQALDREQRRFIWGIMPLSYDPRTAPIALDVPLHPGAERYYREQGYLR